jgi:hypothetical protein
MNFRFNYFRVKETNPDLSIQIVNDIPVDFTNAKKLSMSYFGAENENWIYFERPYFGLKLKILIKNLQGKTEVWMTKPYYLESLPKSFWSLIYAIFRIKFLQKGYFLMHSACLAYGDDAFLISAYADTGKTVTALQCLKQKNFSYLSDDVVIIDKEGFAWSMPRLINYGTLKRSNHLKNNGFASVLRQNIATKLTEIPIFCSYLPSIDAVDIFNALDMSIKERAKLKNVFFIENDKEKTYSLCKDEAFKKLQIINKMEFNSFPDIINTYAFLNREFETEELIEKEKQLMSNIVDSCHSYVLRKKVPIQFADALIPIVKGQYPFMLE